jgi:hypothetical protein
VPGPYFRLKAEMTGDRAEDTSRRADAFAVALTHAATDPAFRAAMGLPEGPADDPVKQLKFALGHAYSDAQQGVARLEIMARLREVIAEVGPAVTQGRLAQLDEIVTARSRGERCGDHVSKVQLELLREALNAAA